MKKFFTKNYNTSKDELMIRTFGLVMFVLSAAYMVTYMIVVG